MMNNSDTEKRKNYQKNYKEKYNKTHHSVNVTLSLKEYKSLQKFAEQENSKPTTVLKELAFAQMNKQTVYPSELLTLLQEHNRLVRSIANNLNQIAHHANIFHEVDKKTVFDHLRQLHIQIEQFSKQQVFNQQSKTTKP